MKTEALPYAADITALHDRLLALPAWPAAQPEPVGGEVGLWVQTNHRNNCLLWAEEDLARRTTVADAAIAANKRAIDGYNQARNDATERVDELLLVADGKVSEFDGDLDDYAAWLAAQRNAEKSPEPGVAAEKTERLAQRADAKANRQALLAQRRPLVKEIEQLERKLGKWNEEKAALDAQFADPAFYATVDRVKSEEMHKQAGLLGEQIDEAEMRWLEVHEALEALPSAD